MMASPFALAWMVLKDATEGPTLGEMADMSPEERAAAMEEEQRIARRRHAPKPEDSAQTTLHDFGG